MTAKAKKIFTAKNRRALSFWHSVTSAAIQDLPMDLSTRQMNILLTVHLEPGPHSIKSIAQALDISKPAICRALNALEKEKLLRRVPDRKDKRNMHVLPTVKGNAFLNDFSVIVQRVAKTLD